MANQLPADVKVTDHFSLFLFELLTEASRAWVREHVSEDAQFLGRSLAVEPRYARDLVDGMQGDGLVVR